MAKPSSNYTYTLDDQRALVSGQFHFHPDLPVTERSRFGDGEWNWFNERNRRFRILPESKLCVDWSRITAGVRRVKPREKRTAKSRRLCVP